MASKRSECWTVIVGWAKIYIARREESCKHPDDERAYLRASEMFYKLSGAVRMFAMFFDDGRSATEIIADAMEVARRQAA